MELSSGVWESSFTEWGARSSHNTWQSLDVCQGLQSTDLCPFLLAWPLATCIIAVSLVEFDCIDNQLWDPASRSSHSSVFRRQNRGFTRILTFNHGCRERHYPRTSTLYSKGNCVGQSFVNLTQIKAIWEEETSLGTMILSHWLVGKSVGLFSWLMVDVDGPSPLWEALPLPGQIVLGCITKEGEQVTKRKQ